jgi:hypothetical protein
MTIRFRAMVGLFGDLGAWGRIIAIALLTYFAAACGTTANSQGTIPSPSQSSSFGWLTWRVAPPKWAESFPDTLQELSWVELTPRALRLADSAVSAAGREPLCTRYFAAGSRILIVPGLSCLNVIFERPDGSDAWFIVDQDSIGRLEAFAPPATHEYNLTPSGRASACRPVDERWSPFRPRGFAYQQLGVDSGGRVQRLAQGGFAPVVGLSSACPGYIDGGPSISMRQSYRVGDGLVAALGPKLGEHLSPSSIHTLPDRAVRALNLAASAVDGPKQRGSRCLIGLSGAHVVLAVYLGGCGTGQWMSALILRLDDTSSSPTSSLVLVSAWADDFFRHILVPE